ncbi:cell division cycle protein 27 homolog [Branchiostoma floridae]|uniref:Cell division cycle protein 27 homolog n=1 Tax=Branchiostoma floridae TaxID=7739 RepID=A0A9J7HKF5_BRAFL|nr:cell division cycle protein 27 homolog [Branchiostoma floridae]
MIMQEPVQAAIWHSLNHYAFADAIFLAERLYAEVGSDEALFLLATCYYRSGKPYRTYMLLQSRGCPTPQCKFLYAKCCIDLEKYAEGESTFMGGAIGKQRSYEELVTEFGDAGCFSMQLLGKIFAKSERNKRATDCYKQSLKHNPFLWSSYQALCDIGEKPDPDEVFQLTNLQNFSSCQSSFPPPALTPHQGGTSDITPPTQDIAKSPLVKLQTPTPTSSTSVGVDMSIGSPQPLVQRVRGRAGRSLLGGPASLSPLTPSFGVLPLDTPSPEVFSTGSCTFVTPSPTTVDCSHLDARAPSKKVVTRRNYPSQTKPAVFSQTGNSGNVKESNTLNTPSPSPSGPQVLVQTTAQGVRRSTRLFTASNSVKENNKKPKTRFAAPKAPAKKTKSRTGKGSSSQPTITEGSEIIKPESTSTTESKPSQLQVTWALNVQKAAAEGLMTLMRDLGHAYLALSHYDCRKAVTLFQQLPQHQYNTGWVLSHIGRAYFELAEYHKAEKAFKEVRKLEPHRVEGMELYSTALWHLQKDVLLSSLAQELSDMDRDSAQSWCAVGNCFSLQREHDTAIKFFQRAIQVEPNFAYAYTLLGHEYVLNEELDKAMSCFRNAIRTDPRHYNAWYGVGMIYYKQEKFSLAEIHFRKALAINPFSSVLLCHIGVVQHALQKSDSALQTLNKAITADPKNPLCKFHKASILFATERYKDALKELEELKQIVPKESLVYFLMGKVYKKLGQTHLALMNFSWAMDLDPKGANNQIKEAIDKRYLPEDDDTMDTEDDITADDAGEDSVTIMDEQPLDLDLQGDGSPGEVDTSNEADAEDVQLHAMESDESL